MLEETISADVLHRAATLAPTTFDPDTRTVEVVFTTGAAVARRDARGAYLETLAVEAADLSGLVGAPVLDAHNAGTARAVLGRVESARVEGGQGVALLRLSNADDVTPVTQRIQDGTLNAVSVGYRVQGWRDGTDAQGRRTKTAIRWHPHEISLVAIPADPGARVRSHDMPDNLPSEAANADPPETMTRAQRVKEIWAIKKTHKLDPDWAIRHIADESDLADVRADALNTLTQRSRTTHVRAHVTDDSNDDPAVIGTRMADALAFGRMGVPGDMPEASRAYAGMGLHDMARNLLAARGERVLSMSAEAVLTRAMHTGDLPNLLQSSGNRTLLGAYQAALSPFFAMVRQTTARGFRAMSRIRAGEMPLLERVVENGEVTRGDVGETVESYAIATYAKMFPLTRQAIINDDLGAFAQVTAMQGRAAAETMNNEAVKLLTQGSGLGPTMADGNRLFHSSHGNVSGSATAVDPAGLAAGVQAMRVQKGVDGKSPINATPRFLLVGPAREYAARPAVASFYPATAATTNPLAGSLEVAVDPRLAGNRSYLFADPAVLPVFEYAFLASAPGPQFESRQGWDVLGMEFRVHLDFGCGALDWRGAYTTRAPDDGGPRRPARPPRSPGRLARQCSPRRGGPERRARGVPQRCGNRRRHRLP